MPWRSFAFSLYFDDQKTSFDVVLLNDTARNGIGQVKLFADDKEAKDKKPHMTADSHRIQ